MHVTVLMSVYNDVGGVEAALASLVAQTYRDWDAVVIDDASTDGSREILHRFEAADPRIAVLRNPRNRGLAWGLNRAALLAEGELLARFDADDECFPERFAQQVTFLAGRPDIDVLGGGAELIDPSGVSAGVTLRPCTHEELAGRIFRENPFIHPTVMMRRRFLAALSGYDERLRRAQDLDLWLRGVARFRYHNLQVPLIRYRTKAALSWQATLYGSYVFARGGWTLRRPLAGLWGGARFALRNGVRLLGAG